MRALVLLAVLFCLSPSSGQYKFFEDGRALRWEGVQPVTYYVASEKSTDFGVDRAIIEQAVDDAFRQYSGAGAKRLPGFVKGTVPPAGVTLELLDEHACSRLRQQSKSPTLPLYRTILVLPDPKNVCAATGLKKTDPRRFLAMTYVDDVKGAPPSREPTITGALVILPPDGVKSAHANGSLRRLILHEIGHALGLSHASVHSGQELQRGAYRTVRDAPIMFPIIAVQDSTLQPNDIAWLRYLYRDGRFLPRDTSIIWGDLQNSERKELAQGFNVVAVDQSSGRRFSALAGYPAWGEFHLPVPSGAVYRLEVHAIPHARLLEPMAPEFYGFEGASALGPLLYRPEALQFDRIEPHYSFGENPSVAWIDVGSASSVTQVPVPVGAQVSIRVRGTLSKVPRRAAF